MRRIFAAFFSVVFLAELLSPVATFASSIDGLAAIHDGDVVGAIAPDRLSAMHAPAPTFVRLARTVPQNPDLSSRRNVNKIGRVGHLISTVLEKGIETPQMRRLDPLAMRHSVAPTGATQRRAVAALGGVVVGGAPVHATAGVPSSSRSAQVAVINPNLACLPPSCYLHSPTPKPTSPPTPTPTPPPTAPPTPTPTVPPTPTPTVPPTPTPTVPPTATPTVAPTPPTTPVLPLSTTGINPWWTYQEEKAPGIGRRLVNIGTGNFILQAEDVDVKGRGIDLAFQRTYNSQSEHNASNSDGSGPAIFGNGWTNTFDAHMAFNASANILSVYDVDGARYDWTSDGQGHWIAPAGLQGETLVFIGCNYDWTKQNGTVYRFANPYASCSTPAGYYGRLTNIFERDGNNSVALYYTWQTNASSLDDIASIQVLHSDSQSLTLTFASFGGNPELASITRPDGSQVSYSYDTSGNLTEVDRPGTNTIAVLPELYGYSGQLMTIFAGPRDSLSYRATGVANDGELTWVNYSGNNIASYADSGTMNFVPSDGTGVALQSGIPTTAFIWRIVTFSGINTGSVLMTDTDGHATNYLLDSIGRETQRSEWTGTQYLVTSSSWNALNELTASIDPRSLETDFLYDSNGNLTTKAEPALSSSMGTLRPLSTYSYDSYHNVIAYCDPVNNALAGRTLVNPTCPTSGATDLAIYDYSDSSEPFGRISSSTDGLGNVTTYQYSTSAQAGVQAGLVTTITQPTFAQVNGASLTPATNYTYDAYGNIVSLNNGSGTNTYQYDGLQRLTTETDADGVSNYRTYNLDGSTQTEQTAYQHQLTSSSGSFVGTAYTYDANGNVIAESLPAAHGSTFQSGTSGPIVPDASHRAVSESLTSGSSTVAGTAATIRNEKPRPSNRWDRYVSFMPKDLSALAVVKATAAERTSSSSSSYSSQPSKPITIFNRNGQCLSLCPRPKQRVARPGYTAASNLGGRASLSDSRIRPQLLLGPAVVTTYKWYDGADRLVEVEQPQDGNADYFPYPWMTRSLYDLTGSGGVPSVALTQYTQTNGYNGAPSSTPTASFAAHGGLYDSQVWVDMGWGSYQSPLPRWVDHTGNAYDALDREISKFDMALSVSPISTNAYDASGNIGLISSSSKITGEISTLNYSPNNKLSSINFSGGATGTLNRSYTYDPDGRTTAVSNALGTLSYVYDANGRILSKTEPSSQGGNVISYSYSPNGWRQTLTVAGMLNRKLFDYAYRADGKESELIAHGGAGSNGTFTWQYTSAGRMTQRTDPTAGYSTFTPLSMSQTTNGPLTYSYDPYGRRNNVTWPNRVSVAMVADALDNPSSDEAYASPWQEPQMFSVRRDHVGFILQGSSIAADQFSANGHLTVGSQCPISGSCADLDPDVATNETFDYLDGKEIETDVGVGGSGVPTDTLFTYDSAGRQTQRNSSGCIQNGGSQGVGGGSSDVSNSSYDAEDHIASMNELATTYDLNCSATNTVSIADSLTWGGDGHPSLITNVVNTGTGPIARNIKLHWDGDSLLFTSDDSGVHEIKIGSIGDVTEEHGYFYVFDRGQDGGIVYDVHSTLSNNSAPSSCGGGLYLDCSDIIQPTDESITLLSGSVTIQGARAIDTESSTWATPDAAIGSIADPVSKLPYVFEHNNSIAFSDPTGYAAQDSPSLCTAASNSCTSTENDIQQSLVATVHTVAMVNPERAVLDGIELGEDVVKAVEQVAKGGVYILKTLKGTVVRTGRTSDLVVREGQHARAFTDLFFESVFHTDSRAAQRGLEQILSDKYKPILDKINPISPTNPNREWYMQEAEKFRRGE